MLVFCVGHTPSHNNVNGYTFPVCIGTSWFAAMQALDYTFYPQQRSAIQGNNIQYIDSSKGEDSHDQSKTS